MSWTEFSVDDTQATIPFILSRRRELSKHYASLESKISYFCRQLRSNYVFLLQRIPKSNSNEARMSHYRRDHPAVLDDADFYTQFATHVLTLAGMVGVVGWATGVNGRILALAGRIWTGRATTDDEEALRRNLQAAESDQGGLAGRVAHALREVARRFSRRSEGAGRVARAISPGSRSEGSEDPNPSGESHAMAELQRAEQELRAAEARVEEERRRQQERQQERDEERRREQVRLGKQPATQNLPIRPGSNAGPSNQRPAASPAPAKMCTKCRKHRAEPDSTKGRCRKCRK